MTRTLFFGLAILGLGWIGSVSLEALLGPCRTVTDVPKVVTYSATVAALVVIGMVEIWKNICQ